MKIQNTVILLFVALFAGFLHPQASFAKWGSSGLTLEFASGYSGDTNTAGCGSATCHTGHANNSGGGSVSVAVKSGGSTVTGYTGGQIYTVEVTIAHSGLSRWGFQATAKKSSGSAAGTFASSDTTTEINLYSSALSTNDYIQSSGSDSNLAGAKDGMANSATYSFTWTAPAAGTGTVTFYAAGVAADGDGAGETDTGDYPYTTTATLAEGSSTPAPTTPTIDIKVNGSDGPVIYTGRLEVSVSLTAGSVAGTNGDWFVAAAYGSTWYYYNLTTGWQAGLNVTHQGALGDLPTYTFPTLTATLPSGTYTLYFAVDTNMNGSVDTAAGSIYYDTVTMTVP